MGKTPDFDTELAKFSPRQLEAVKLLDSGKIKFLLYGGALGGGKSYFLRWYGIRRLMILHQVFGISNAPGMVACEDYPSLADRQLMKISLEFPGWLGRLYDKHKVYGRCFILAPKWGSGVLCFRNLDDPSKYASSEWAFILVDELTKNKYDIFTFLRTRLRCPSLPDIECQFAAGTNPGSIGHGWVKQLWMDKTFPPEWTTPIDYRDQFAYVPSKANDNPHLGADYWAMLETLPEQLRKAFKDGDWDIFLGQAFPQFSKDIHVIKPIPVPAHAQTYMTFDWGFGAPFSIGWWWVDSDGRVYRCGEWYGWDGQANSGLRLEDSAIADGITAREKELKLNTQRIIRLSGPDCFSKKPDYKGGGQGPSTAEVFAGRGIYLTPGDPNRQLKIRQFRERLRVPIDGTPPMMLIYNTCVQFIRTIADIVMDEVHIEDIDTKTEDHIYDEACHICMARPLALNRPEQPKRSIDKRIEELKKIKTRDVDILAHENEMAYRGIRGDEFDFDTIDIDDTGEMVRTV